MKKEKTWINAYSHDSLYDLSNNGDLLDKDQVTSSSKLYSDTTVENLNILIQEKIKDILEVGPVESVVNWDLIKSASDGMLGDFLKIQDYNTNLFSNWTLRLLLQQIISHGHALNKCDYTLFIYWIYEEINLIRDNTDMTRDTFFALINEIFRMAMSKILEGKGLLHPLSLISEFWEQESESISKIYIAKCESEIKFSTKNNEELKIDAEINADPQFESTIKYFENALYVIIKATYELYSNPIFSKETDFTLIQTVSVDEKNSLNYTLPYHFRTPKVVKKVDTSRKLSNTSNSRQKSIKTKKLIRKSSSDNNTLASTGSGNILKKSDYILPLSGIVACQNCTQYTEQEKETKNV